MPTTRSAAKAMRRDAQRTLINRMRVSRMRTYVRRVEEALAEGDAAKAQTAMREAQPEIIRAATRGPMHARTCARKVSRLAKRTHALATGTTD